MPEDAFEDIDVLPERIVIPEKIEKAEKDIVDGNLFATQEAKEKLIKWLE